MSVAYRNREDYRTTDWQLDFSSLPRWNVRDVIPFVYDKFYPIPQSDMLCCIYSIAEVRMGWSVGFLAILKNKDQPELILNITEMNFCDNFSVSQNGDIIFLQASVYHKATNRVCCPILILDLVHGKFSYRITYNYNPCYEMIELSNHIFGMKADEMQRKTDKQLNALTKQTINLGTLKWYDFGELKTLSEKIQML